MQAKEAIMIELTEQQSQALAAAAETPPVAVDPKTNTSYVLLRQEVYERLMDQDYDDSPWTAEEMELLAWEAGKEAGWEDMDEYDHYPEKR
jgi:hypothetical protein